MIVRLTHVETGKPIHINAYAVACWDEVLKDGAPVVRIVFENDFAYLVKESLDEVDCKMRRALE